MNNVTPEPQLRAVLIAARALIEDPAQWTQGAYWLDAQGKSCRYQEAVRFCASEAIISACRDMNMKTCEPVNALFAQAAFPNRWVLISSFNDASTHHEVIAAFDRAIDLAPAGEG